MNPKQLELLTSMITGIQLAIVHLAKVVAHSSNVAPDAIATSFDDTAAAVPEGTVNREVVQMIVRQISSGIRNSEAGPEWDNLMSRLRQ